MVFQDRPRTRQPSSGTLLAPQWMSIIHACVDVGNLQSFLNGSVGVAHQGYLTTVRGSGYWTAKVSREGYRVGAMSYNQISTHLPRQLITLNEFTLFGVGYIGSAAGATTQILAAIANLNAPTYLADIIFNRTSGKIEARLYKGGWVTLDSGITFDYGRTYSCALTAKSGYVEFYVDGRLVATNSSAGWVTYSSMRDLCLGNSEYDYFRLNGGVALGGVTRSFSPRVAQMISANPWQIFWSEGELGSAGAAPSSLVELILANINHGHLLEAPALVQQHAIALSDLVHAQLADAITLSASVDLALADVLHAQLADAISIVQQHLVTLANIDHAQLADAISIVQQHLLSTNNVDHAHLAEALALVQQHTLVSQNIDHSHLLDTPTLVQQHAITLADALHAHSAEAVQLAVQSILAMDDVAHTQTAEGVTLTVGLAVSPANINHAHLTDAPALQQQHLLELIDTLHSQSVDAVDMAVGSVLAVADVLHPQELQSPALVSYATLVIEDLLHDQTLSTVLLSQAHVLVLADINHAHLASVLSLTIPGSVISLPGRTLVVAAEGRILVIVSESRALAIEAESRIVVIH